MGNNPRILGFAGHAFRYSIDLDPCDIRENDLRYATCSRAFQLGLLSPFLAWHGPVNMEQVDKVIREGTFLGSNTASLHAMLGIRTKSIVNVHSGSGGCSRK